MRMINYFGINIREKPDGLKITRENYIKVNAKSSLVKGKVYDECFLNKHTEACLSNFDLNMEYFRSLSKEEFNNELLGFLNKTKVFTEITDLLPLNRVPGYYIMVLDDYSQAYLGRSNDIKKRIQSHWSKQKEFDRLIFGGVEDSILSVDSFRAYDTTRIFVYQNSDIHGQEDYFINHFNNKFLLNRTSGGTLLGFVEALANMKTRALS